MNSSDERVERARKIYQALAALSQSQFELVDSIIEQITRPYIGIFFNPASDIITNCISEALGDSLRVHHCFSREPLSKDRFEYAFERAGNLCNLDAKLAPKGNPGHDLTVNSRKFSLKTEASKQIKQNFIHISKFMELGKGVWDLEALRSRFFRHMDNYDRIITLRCLSQIPTRWHYELVEIPKILLLEAQDGELKIREDSTQNPKPGHCFVRDDTGELKYQLYFDGGTERKLQIQHIRKSLCIVHAEWIFRTYPVLEDDTPLNSR